VFKRLQVRMGWGSPECSQLDEDGASSAVLRGYGWGGDCLGMPAHRSWPRSKSKGVPQAAASSKKQPDPWRGRIARSHPRHGALPAHDSGSSLLLSAAYVSRRASGKPHGTEASRLGLGSWHCGR